MSADADEVHVGSGTGSCMAPHRRRLLLQVWALATMGFAVRAIAGGWLGPVERARGVPWSPVTIDVNVAGVDDLAALPGVGAGRAEAIVLHRVRHGWFKSLDDLLAVDGIGAETVAVLRPHATAGTTALR